MKYKQVHSGEWVLPARRGYKMACCDCGLVHVMNFKLVPHARGKKILFQAFRDDRKTAAVRRSQGTRKPA